MQGKVRRIAVALSLVVAMLAGSITALLAGCTKPSNLHTYNEYISVFPTSWNTHNSSSETDNFVQLYTEMGLYAMTFNEARTSHTFVDEMALGDPIDVTTSLVGQYGISTGEKGKAWRINLNRDATWENNVPITADDYIESMKLLLDPDIRNRGAVDYYTGSTALYNAYNYFKGSGYVEYKKIQQTSVYSDEDINQLIADSKLYFSFDIPLLDGEGMRTYAQYHALESQRGRFLDENGVDSYATLFNALNGQQNEYGWIEVTNDNLNLIRTNLKVLGDNMKSLALPDGLSWYSLCAVERTVVMNYSHIDKPEDGGSPKYTEEELNRLISEEELYFSFSQGDWLAGTSIENLYYLFEANKDRYFIDYDTKKDWFQYLSNKWFGKENVDGYICVTPELKQDLIDFVAFIQNGVTYNPSNGVVGPNALRNFIPSWETCCFVAKEEEMETIPFDQVGIFKVDDSSFVLVFNDAQQLWDVKYALTRNWIVYRDYYTLVENGNLKSTTYGTVGGQYMAYGPYKLESYQVDKELVFVRNENWYGYKEGKTNYHPGEFQTDRIVAQVIENQATALTEFLSGHLDQVRLTANDLDTYKFSDNLLRRTASNTWQLDFNSDPEALKKIEADGQGNRTVLSNKSFRKAISLMIDRNYVGATIAGNSAGALSFLNSNYYYDMENNSDSIYRNTPEAKRALVELYGITYGENNVYKTLDEAYATLTGYDLEEARALFRLAANETMATGHYSRGETVKINIYVNTITQALTAFGDYLQSQVDLATQKTPFEGKVRIEIKAGESGRLEDMRNGKIECMYFSFAGNYNAPAEFFSNYLSTSQPYEYGFDPTTATLTLTIDGIVRTQSLEQWYQTIIAGGEFMSDNAKKLSIMAALEKEILANYQSIPLWVGTDSLLYSHKINYPTTNANVFVAYGGVRLMTYNYTDGEWEKFCRRSSNLNYV